MDLVLQLFQSSVTIFSRSVIYGMGNLAGLNDGEDTPGSKAVFLSTSVGTMIGACFGCTPLIVYVESAAGIGEGGKTGLTGDYKLLLTLAMTTYLRILKRISDDQTLLTLFVLFLSALYTSV